MRRPHLLTLLACALLTLISPQVLAQADDPLTEAFRLSLKCKAFYSAGKYGEALEPCQRALEINENKLGPEHLDVATSLSNLAALHRARGDDAKAELLYQRSLAIIEKARGNEHLDVATALNNLAGVYLSKRDYAKAGSLFRRALAIREKELGPEHPDVANSLNSIAALLHTMSEYSIDLEAIKRARALAEQYYQRALAIYEKEYGPEHLSLTTPLGNLAQLYYRRGEDAKAEPLMQRALAIREKAQGDKHPDVAQALHRLADFYAAVKDYPRAIEFQERAQEVRENNISAILATGSEKQKQLYLDLLSTETEKTVSLHAYSAPDNPQAARLALTTILRRKGRALDAMTDQIAGLRRRAATEDVKLLDALAAAQSQLANLQLSNDTTLPPAETRARVTALETKIEKLQSDIGSRSAEFRARTEAVTLKGIQKVIPADAALVEIFAYRPYHADAKVRMVYVRNRPSRYVAYVLKPADDAPQFVDLGETAVIDADLKLWREALQEPERADVRSLGRRVDERVMRLIRKLLGTTKRLFISPDGALNLIPFAALVDESNKYLVESYDINYLTSGRDLLRLKVGSENRAGAFVFANPTYNLTGQTIAACGRPKRKRGLIPGADEADAGSDKDATIKREIEYRGIDFTKVCYPPLKGTAQEATRINTILPKATLLTDKRATEAALKAQNAPAILHVATHGFFLPDQPTPAPNTNQPAPGEVVGNSTRATTQSENPLLRSGLIMAGANQKSSGPNEDGVLTAAEAANLNLWGTKLVVLSACETGLGDVINGAGVYGLRRALVLAGSETQVMSLWQVSDTATRDLMADYYTRLQQGAGRTEAMRQAQLAMLRDRRRDTAHPFYWAAFISSGDWRSMNGK